MQFSGSSASAPPSNPVATFFRTNFNACLAVFDVRRGQCEGEEHEKLLSFFPTTAPVHVRTSIVGLAQAVCSFAGSLTQADGTAFKTMVADTNKWIMFEAEPDIWVLAVIRKAWAGSTCTDAAFKYLLTCMHNVFVLLHGRMGTLLEQDPTGFAVRRVLQPLLDEVGSRLLRPETKEHAGLANPLGPHHPTAVPLLTTSHPTFLAIQCLVNQLMIASFFGTRLVCGCMVLWGGMPLASTLGAEDSAALAALAAKALAPAAKAAQQVVESNALSPACPQHRPTALGAAAGALGAAAGGLGLGTSASAHGETAFETLLSPLQWCAGGGIQPPPPVHTTFSVYSTYGQGGGLGTPGGGSSAAASDVGGALGMGLGMGLPTSTPATAGTGASFLPASTPASAGSAIYSLPHTPPGAAASPQLPVSSSASASAAAVGGVGGSGLGAPLPRFLSSFLRPRLRPSMYSPAGMALPLSHDSVMPIAHVWLRGTHEWAQLLPYHRGQLLVLVLLHDGPPPGSDLLAALAALLTRGSAPAVAALAAELPSRSSVLWHERGHRYCYTDSLCQATRYTPLKKVLTLSSSALRHLAHLRSKLDEWQVQQQQQRPALHPGEGAGGAGSEADGECSEATAEHPAPADPAAAAGAGSATNGNGACSSSGAKGGGAAECDGDSELIVHTGLGAWVVLRAAPAGRRLYTAADPGPDMTLATAAHSTDVLGDRLFPGVFLPP